MNLTIIILTLINLIILITILFQNKKQNKNEKLNEQTTIISTRLNDLIIRQQDTNKLLNEELAANREEQSQNIYRFQERFTQDMVRSLNQVSSRIEEISKRVDENLKQIRTDNNTRLDEMRKTVDEKLQNTLESRISTSFKQVSSQLEKVYEELGKMKTLSEGVGSLQRILTNVKSRGIWGEVQARRILQDILSPGQYLENVQTRKNSQFRVEFAIRLPGALLPIDSKFPREDYEHLQESQEKGDLIEVKKYRDALSKRIKEEAGKIQEKYINVPVTTDFALLFLPVEGLYAEVLSLPGIVETVQKEYHVVIAGPTTLASLLNSLQVGFQTLAVEKKSTEVWNVLGQVKTEFGKFGQVLESLKTKLDQANTQLDNAFKRTRAIDRKLRNVDSLPIHEQKMITGDEDNDEVL